MRLVVLTVIPALVLLSAQLVLLLGSLKLMLALKAVQLPNLLIMQQELARTVLLTVIHAQMQTLAPYVPQIGSWIQVQINAHKPVQPNSSEIQEQEHVRHD